MRKWYLTLNGRIVIGSNPILTTMEEYRKFIKELDNLTVLRKLDNYFFISKIKKELNYKYVLDEDLILEDFMAICHKYIDDLGENDKNLVLPLLRDFKLKMLNI